LQLVVRATYEFTEVINFSSSQNPRVSSHFLVVVYFGNGVWYSKMKIIEKFKIPYI
jgi:hypothetical protein